MLTARDMRAKFINFALVCALIMGIRDAIAETYDECILTNLKGVTDRYIANQVHSACRRKTMPKQCRQYLGGIPFAPWPPMECKKERSFDEMIYGRSDCEAVAQLNACLKGCEEASYWDKTFGECAPD